jgi:RNA polymerase sigma factor (sigma-70 family)
MLAGGRLAAQLSTDEPLTRRAAAGDRRAFAAIFRRYHQDLYRYCLAILRSPDDAQDALQSTMVKAMQALPGESRHIDLKPWLYRIAHNESIDIVRRRAGSAPLPAELAAPGPGLAREAESRERLGTLLADLETLPERQRGALVMRELSGLEFAEIGAALGTSAAVARQTVYEARLSLRQIETGREMRCDEVTMALSEADGRVTRRRDIRAHLRACPDCRRFGEEIDARSRDLAALAPLPALAAGGLVQGLFGSQTAGAGSGLAGALGGGAAKTLGGSAALKATATVAVVAAIGAGAAQRADLIHLGLPGEGGGQASKAAPASAGQPGGTAAPGEAAATPATEAAARGLSDVHTAQGAPGNARALDRSAPVPASAADPSSPATSAQSHGNNGHPALPDAASHGQQTAASHKAAAHGASGSKGNAGNAGKPSHPAKPAKPSHPAHPAKPAKEAATPAPPTAAEHGKSAQADTNAGNLAPPGDEEG